MTSFSQRSKQKDSIVQRLISTNPPWLTLSETCGAGGY